MVLHKANDYKIDANLTLLCDDKEIERVFSFKYLGIILDPSLNFNLHYEYVTKRMSSAIGVLSRLKRFLPFHSFTIF